MKQLPWLDLVLWTTLVTLAGGCTGAPPPPAAGQADAGSAPRPAVGGHTAEPTTTAAQTATPPGKIPSAPPAHREAPITGPDQLIALLKQHNAGFAGEVVVQPMSPELLIVGIRDPHLKDLRPLARQRIGKLDLRGCDVTDLSPLAGMPIIELYLEDNHHLTDISPLRGMPLQKLYLCQTGVQNLGPLRGAPLDELNLVGTRVTDLGPVSESPIRMLWLNDCPVEDITPLGKLPLESLTLENAPVRDLTPLAGNRMQRLHIAGTAVTDLTPLKGLRLSRLIFTPGRIQTGLEIARQMTSLREIGTKLEERQAPADFWHLYDEGKLK